MARSRRRPSAPAPATGRERILDAALDLFYRHGIRAVGVDTLIARAGVAKMTFYKHFPSKDDLVVAFLQRRDAQWRAWLEAAVAGRATAPRERLLAIFDAFAEWFASEDFRGCAFVNATAELADRAHPAHQAVVEHKARLAAYLRRLVVDAGIGDPDRVTAQLGLLMDGAIVTALREGSPAAAVRAREMAAALIRGQAFQS